MVSYQMNTPSPPFEKLEASLERLRARIPEMPVNSVLLSRLVLHLGRGVGAMLEQQIRPFGLAEAEFRVLATLFSQPQGVAHPSDLCVRTSQSPANMSRICDALVERDLITRVASLHDRRKMVLRITETGEELVQHLLPTLFRPLREMFKDFTEQEQAHLVEQLKRLGAQIDRVMGADVGEREG